MKSVRWTALVWMAAVLTPIALASSVIAYVAGREEANFVSDGLLTQIAHQLAPETDVRQRMLLLDDPEDRLVVSIWDGAGRLVRDNSKGLIPRQAGSGFIDAILEGTAWRIFVAHAGGYTVQVAQRQEVRDEVAEHLALSAALPTIAALPLVWGLVAFGLTRLFRQLDNTSVQIARQNIHNADLLPLTDVPVEIRGFVRAMNELLRRQAAAIEQQRRFVSDAAHELRTPLAAVQILTDTMVARSARGAPVESDILQELEAALRRAREMVNQLLKLAEIEAGRERRTYTTVELRNVLANVVSTLMPLATHKGMEVRAHSDGGTQVVAAPADIHTLFSVLVDNALRYGPSQSTVEIKLRLEGRAALLEVRDHGLGIPAKTLPRIYDRFFRLAPQATEGSGLGLAIAKAIADRYGYTLNISNHASGGIIAQVSMPLKIDVKPDDDDVPGLTDSKAAD